jgi:histidine triad (HIT) family protein
MKMDDCLFCRIVAGEIPAAVVGANDGAIAFRDIDPQAPTHLLVVPRRHHDDVVAMLAAAPVDATAVLTLAAEVIGSEGLTGGHRWVFNTGPDGGQAVDHVHLHVLGGRQLTWPPG